MSTQNRFAYKPLEYRKKKEKSIEPFIDFGLVIQDFRKVEQLKIWFPFSFDKNDFYDLFDKVKEDSPLIFNDNECEIKTSKGLSLIEKSEDGVDKLLVKLNDEENLMFERNKSDNNIQTLNINFNRIKSDPNFEEHKNVYLRFRIKTPNLKKFIFCQLNKKNLFLESAFIATQIIDLKINKKRNIPQKKCDDFRLQHYSFAKFNKIHFLLMDYANNDTSILGNDFVECRKLEDDEWNKYLEDEYNTKDVLVYHWKKKCDDFDKHPIMEYSKLVKVTTSTTNKKILLAYIFIMIALGFLGNLLFATISLLFHLL